MGSSKQTSSSQSEPWAPTIPILNQLLGGISGLAGNGFGASGYQNSAIQQIMSNLAGMKNYGPQAGKLTDKFLTGDPNGLLRPAYQNYQNSLNPIANAPLDPLKTPGIGNVLSTIRSDISNNVNGMFAGAGRDLSGMHVQALGRGISQGEAVPLLNQYNQNVASRMGAANGLLGAAGATSTAMGQNQQTGMGMVGQLPGIYNQIPMAQLQAASMEKNIPIQNIAQLLALTAPIAGMGGQNYSQTTSTPSLMSQIGQGMQLGGSLFGLGGSLMGGFPMMGGGAGMSSNPFAGFSGNYFPKFF